MRAKLQEALRLIDQYGLSEFEKACEVLRTRDGGKGLVPDQVWMAPTDDGNVVRVIGTRTDDTGSVRAVVVKSGPAICARIIDPSRRNFKETLMHLGVSEHRASVAEYQVFGQRTAGREALSAYVAASFPRRHEAEAIASALRSAGIRVTARWIDLAKEQGSGYAEHPRFTKQEMADHDLEDIVGVDFVVVLTGDTETKGGRHSEVGIALALKKPVFLVGPREQVFHYASGIAAEYASIDELRNALAAETFMMTVQRSGV
jgi:hypothetical protein